MLDIHSALAGVLSSGKHGAIREGGPGVSLSGTHPVSLVQIAGWRDFEEQAMPGLQKLGFVDVGDFRQCRDSGDMRLYRLSPDRVWIAAQSPIALPESLRNNTSLAVLDIKHARCGIIVEGPGAVDVMARLAPIDLRLAAMPAGAFVQTGIHHVGVLIHRTAEMRFEILVPVTWARSIWDFLCLNAAPFGYEVKGVA